ncbi:hypothetical protein M2105_004260 [Paenibacillus sp. PastF-1]|nr:hypothetical protein [Paenibacillus sp. PastF-2]MDF9849695.1 hypothetical protein [Paenibacillus sp. PastM-2]MDF9856387.1 hypothetical protein [Paenibacillus sp. PastF-1]MDH6481659.1 hypothetical protein [Paenibacillus sp. PastH-2]MDH6508940.1 hypothetical protein [Paenibacillus sp. PastM-3]
MGVLFRRWSAWRKQGRVVRVSCGQSADELKASGELCREAADELQVSCRWRKVGREAAYELKPGRELSGGYSHTFISTAHIGYLVHLKRLISNDCWI